MLPRNGPNGRLFVLVKYSNPTPSPLALTVVKYLWLASWNGWPVYMTELDYILLVQRRFSKRDKARHFLKTRICTSHALQTGWLWPQVRPGIKRPVMMANCIYKYTDQAYNRVLQSVDCWWSVGRYSVESWWTMIRLSLNRESNCRLTVGWDICRLFGWPSIG